MSKVLVHICCAHCAAYTVEHWRKEGCEAAGFWYNPNIHPFTEHNLRLEGVKALAAKLKFPLIIAPGYDVVEYFRRVAGNEADRCRHCFDLRLSKTAAAVLENGFDAFTTTLLISPHQKHEIIKETGERVAGEQGVAFLYADLRKRYSDSRHITKPLDLYRQQYCGCIYSEWERYRDQGAAR
jgi:predicted adenine nucleotide alpha hydrolase (AANH) superfamily ATPase